MRSLRHTIWLLLLTLLSTAFVGAAAGAEKLDMDAAHSYIYFQVEHLGLANSFGRFNDITGSITFDEAAPANSKFIFSVAAASVDTGNQKRDTHLRSADFFNVEKHPTITFESQSVKQTGPNRFEVTGEMTLLGTSRSVTTEVVQTGSGEDPWGNFRRGFESTFTIKRSDYGMNHLLKAVGDEVVLTVSVEGMRKL
ncbi:MAG: YceI family protein [Desulfosarcinaceae bacterium]|nr:YceI family protein [Desulfosarcinaceae bacterium]